jgi:hypothetical protein
MTLQPVAGGEGVLPDPSMRVRIGQLNVGMVTAALMATAPGSYSQKQNGRAGVCPSTPLGACHSRAGYKGHSSQS